VADRVDQHSHRLLATTTVSIGIGGDDLLINQLGDADREVLISVEHTAEAGVLACKEQLQAGAGDAPDPIQRIPVCPRYPGCCQMRWRIRSSLAPASATT
jgi:hypothetical protein